MGTFIMISLFVTTHRDTKRIQNLSNTPMLKGLHIFLATTLGLLKIKNNSLISRGGKGSQLYLRHNEHTTAVFTSFVLITFCHFLRLHHQHCLKFTSFISRAIPREQDGPILPARVTNQNQGLQIAHGHCQRNDLERWLSAHVTKNLLKYR